MNITHCLIQNITHYPARLPIKPVTVKETVREDLCGRDNHVFREITFTFQQSTKAISLSVLRLKTHLDRRSTTDQQTRQCYTQPEAADHRLPGLLREHRPVSVPQLESHRFETSVQSYRSTVLGHRRQDHERGNSAPGFNYLA